MPRCENPDCNVELCMETRPESEVKAKSEPKAEDKPKEQLSEGESRLYNKIKKVIEDNDRLRGLLAEASFTLRMCAECLDFQLPDAAELDGDEEMEIAEIANEANNMVHAIQEGIK